MNELAAIAAVGSPATRRTLVADLQSLGLPPGCTVMVHSSLSALGWTVGGPQAVVEALLDAVGSSGTVVMPTQSGHLSDPAHWSNPPVPGTWHELIRREMPAYDPALTPTRSMGQVVECFRHHPQTQRSAHPTLSVAANGPAAASIVGTHPLTPGLGEPSPLGRLYELDAIVLLLGVGHGNNTSLHLAEYRANWPAKQWTEVGAPVFVDGRRQWVTYADLELDESDFELIGDAFATTGAERSGPVGNGIGRLCRQRELVDFAVTWMEANRPGRRPA
jgi:aminoglycoside 3-N-acetyltransferase